MELEMGEPDLKAANSSGRQNAPADVSAIRSLSRAALLAISVRE